MVLLCKTPRANKRELSPPLLTMKKRRYVIAAAIVSLLIVSYAIYRKMYELELQMNWAEYAGKRSNSLYDPGPVARIVDSLFRGPPTDDWMGERDRVIDDLVERGFLVRKLGFISTNDFKAFFYNMTDDEEDMPLLRFSYSVHTNAPRREIFFIGPPEIVDKAMLNLGRINSNRSEQAVAPVVK